MWYCDVLDSPSTAVFTKPFSGDPFIKKYKPSRPNSHLLTHLLIPNPNPNKNMLLVEHFLNAKGEQAGDSGQLLLSINQFKQSTLINLLTTLDLIKLY